MEGGDEAGNEKAEQAWGGGTEAGVRPIPVNLFPLFTQLSGRSHSDSVTSPLFFFLVFSCFTRLVPLIDLMQIQTLAV